MKKYLKFEYFYLVFILIWPPFNRLIFKMDGAGRTVLILSVFLIARLALKKDFAKIAFGKPTVIWGIWVIYAFVNSLLKGYYHDDLPAYSLLVQISVPYILMVTINFLSINDQKKLLNVLIFGMYLSVLIILFFNTSAGGDRYSGQMNSNTVGIMSTILSMLIYLKYHNKSISLIKFILLSIVPVTLIITTGSRTAFGGLIMLILTHFIINRSKSVLITILQFSLGIALLILPLNFVLHNTALGERIQSTTQQSEEGIDMETGNVLLDKFGDRGIYYYLGWQVFSENPVSGIGLDNFMDYTGGEFKEQHSEYMIQLSELGIIGFLIFFFFYFSIFKDLFNIRSNSSQGSKAEIYIAYVIIILIMITATRMFRVWHLFMIIGVVTGYITKAKHSNNRIKKISKYLLKMS